MRRDTIANPARRPCWGLAERCKRRGVHTHACVSIHARGCENGWRASSTQHASRGFGLVLVNSSSGEVFGKCALLGSIRSDRPPVEPDRAIHSSKYVTAGVTCTICSSYTSLFDLPSQVLRRMVSDRLRGGPGQSILQKLCGIHGVGSKACWAFPACRFCGTHQLRAAVRGAPYAWAASPVLRATRRRLDRSSSPVLWLPCAVCLKASARYREIRRFRRAATKYWRTPWKGPGWDMIRGALPK